MGTIGSIVVNLEANSAQFEKNTKSAVVAVEELGHSADGLDLKSKFEEGLGIGAGIEAIHMAGEAIEKLVDVGKEAAEAVADTVKEVTATFRLAGTLHIPTDSLMAYQNAAKAVGIDTESFNSALQKLEKNMGEAAQNGGIAAEGFTKLGLSAKDLANQGIDKSFEQIADKIAALPNPSAQAAAAFEVFGKKGQELLPMLQMGAAGLEKYKEEGKEFGNTLNDFEAAKLVAVNDEFLKMGERVEGIKDRIVVALAPALLSIGEHILALVPDAETMKNSIVSGLHAVAMGIGYILDGWQLFKVAVLGVETVVAGAMTAMLMEMDVYAHGLQNLINKLPGMHVQMTQGLDAALETAKTMTNSLADQTKEAWNKPWPHQAVDAAFAHINAESDKAANALVAGKDKMAGPIGDELEKAGKKGGGVFDELLKHAVAFGKGVASEMEKAAEAMAKHQEQIAAEGKRIFESVETPLEKYNDRIAELNKALADGAINQDIYGRAVAKATEELNQQHEAKTKGIGAENDKAKAEARRFDFHVPGGHSLTKHGDAQKELVKKADAQLQLTKQQTWYISEQYRFQREANLASKSSDNVASL